MSFKVRKIRTEKPTAWWKRLFTTGKSKRIWIVSLLTVLLGGGLLLAKTGIFSGKAERIFSFQTLKEDKYGHTNILFLGVGGEFAEGGHLSDSIMIVSINPELPSLSMLSFPRDLFVSSQIGDRKVNEIYAAARYKYGDAKGLEIVTDALANFSGIDIHYSSVVDFQIFSDGIDLIGGIDLFVPSPIEDPFYPDSDYGYQTFVIRSGLQTLDGETALKYARSRKTSSDYDRARRQQDILLAIRQKIEAEGIASSPQKIKELYDLLRRRVNTDIGITELIALAKIGMGIDYGDVLSVVLNDDPTRQGGFLFTPAKEFYGGQFVLLPEDFEDTQTFMNLVLSQPEILLENAQISIQNASKISGKAGELGARLKRIGFHVIDIGNHDSERPIARSKATNFSGKKVKKSADFLSRFLGVPFPKVSPEAGAVSLEKGLIDLEIILGTN